jgi:NAD+ kinase
VSVTSENKNVRDKNLTHQTRIAFVASDVPEAQTALLQLRGQFSHTDPDHADIIVALGGDGLMLQVLHRFMGQGKAIYGMNRGSVGFLMNDFRVENLMERIKDAERSIIHPLIMRATDTHQRVYEARAINEVSVFRQSYQAAKLALSVDGRMRMDELIADGVLVATPAGSTAYNLSANGPILPLKAPMLALTPISAFRPRRWRGALLPEQAKITITVLEADKRPVNAVADHTEFRSVETIDIEIDHGTDLVMLHDPDHGLEERILREQFGG